MSTVDRDYSDRARMERLNLIRAELLPRIRPLCPDMPNDLFAELVEAMAEVQLKYELHENARAIALDDGPIARAAPPPPRVADP